MKMFLQVVSVTILFLLLNIPVWAVTDSADSRNAFYTPPLVFTPAPASFAPEGFLPDGSPAKNQKPGCYTLFYKPWPIPSKYKDEWYTVAYFPMLWRDNALAKQRLLEVFEECRENPRSKDVCQPIRLGDEAFIYFHTKKDGEYKYNNMRIEIRQGRMTSRVTIRGSAVQTDYQSGKSREIVYPAPSDTVLVSMALEWHKAWLKYAHSQGWKIDVPGKLPNGKKTDYSSLPATLESHEMEDSVVDVGRATSTMAETSSLPFTGFTTTTDSPRKGDTPKTVSTATAATGALTVIGSLLMLGASGIRPQDVTEALKEWINGQASTETEAIEEEYPDTDYEDYEEESPEYKNGDTNKDGDVWSDRYGGWVGSELLEFDKQNASRMAEAEQVNRQEWLGQDKRVKEAADKLSDSRQQGQALGEYFDKREELEDKVDKLWQKDSESLDLDENRKHLLDKLSSSADELAQSGDYIGALKRVQGLGNVVSDQMRDGYKPTYTYKDAIIDTGVQFGALALDSTVTMGFASTAAGSGIAMRDAAVDGKSTGEILWSGAKAGAVDFVFGKTTEKLVDVLRVIRGVKVPGGAVVDSSVDLMQNTGRNMNALENSLSVNKSGLKEAKLDDVLSIQRKPHQVRNLKQFGTEEMQEGFNNTLRTKVYKPHDDQLLDSIRRNNPDLADSKLVVHEFRTPGAKSSNINTDRDFRILSQNKQGDWVEVPRKKWEPDSNEIFGNLTGYDSSKCPKGLSEVDKKAWWAEQHSHTPTDKIHIEASADYSDQVTDVIDVDGQKHGKVIRSQVKKPQIEILKEIADDKVTPATPIKLKDPQQLGSMFDEKIHGSLRRNDPYEAIAQAKKGVNTLDKVRVAYDKQGLLPKGNKLPVRFEKAMDLLRKSNLDARPSAAGLKKLNVQLSDLGFRDLNDFGKKMSGQYESLKYL